MSVSPASDLLQEGLALHRRGAVDEAAARYTDVLRADPANADALYYLALISCQHGRFEEGAELARKSLAGDPKQARSHVRDPAHLAALKDRLIRNRDTFPQFDTQGATRHIETAYRTMADIARRREKPRSFDVTGS
jgi:tetratricopeptide (TPR) repeat protein